jgi:NAD(P) transhydrogenase subunit alpha
VGTINLASTVPYHASQMYGRNISTYLRHVFKDGKPEIDLEDEITRETLITRGGEIVHGRVREFFSLPARSTQTLAQ